MACDDVGTYDSGNNGASRCKYCPSGKYLTNGAATAADCKYSFFSVITSNQCENHGGREPNANECEKAGSVIFSGKFMVASMQSRPPCYKTNGGTTYTSNSNNNYGASNTRHVICRFDCPSGMYEAGIGSGSSAPVDIMCRFCPNGWYDQGIGQPCQQCAANTFSSFGSTTCSLDSSSCPAGTYTSVTTTVCDSCGIGKYNDQTGHVSEAACKNCDIGKYNDEIAQSSCKGCEKGYVSASGSSSVDACQLCPMGWLGEGKGQGCARCPVGKWSSDFWDGKVASECASSYIGVIVSGTCLSHGGSIPVSLSADECNKALQSTLHPTDDFVEAGTASDPPCYHFNEKRYYNVNSGTGYNASIEKVAVCFFGCPVGFAATNFEQQIGNRFPPVYNIACRYCPVGWFAKNQKCSKCNAGMYQDWQKQTSCKSCALGTYSITGARTCAYDESSCPDGSYPSSPELAACYHCPAGKYQIKNGQSGKRTCISCLESTYSIAGATACSYRFRDCPTNTYQIEPTFHPGLPQIVDWGGQCTKCDPLQWDGVDVNQQCLSCPAGQYIEGQSCEQCAEGKWIEKTTGKNQVSECSPAYVGRISSKTCKEHNGIDITNQADCEKAIQSVLQISGTLTLENRDNRSPCYSHGNALFRNTFVNPDYNASTEFKVFCKFPCPAGRYSNFQNQISTTTPPTYDIVCKWCPLGWISKGAGKGCSRCLAGNFNIDALYTQTTELDSRTNVCSLSHIGVIVSGKCEDHQGGSHVIVEEECKKALYTTIHPQFEQVVASVESPSKPTCYADQNGWYWNQHANPEYSASEAQPVVCKFFFFPRFSSFFTKCVF